MTSETSSDGMTANDIFKHSVVPDLPFGGVGKSLLHPVRLVSVSQQQPLTQVPLCLLGSSGTFSCIFPLILFSLVGSFVKRLISGWSSVGASGRGKPSGTSVRSSSSPVPGRGMKLPVAKQLVEFPRSLSGSWLCGRDSLAVGRGLSSWVFLMAGYVPLLEIIDPVAPVPDPSVNFVGEAGLALGRRGLVPLTFQGWMHTTQFKAVSRSSLISG